MRKAINALLISFTIIACTNETKNNTPNNLTAISTDSSKKETIQPASEANNDLVFKPAGSTTKNKLKSSQIKSMDDFYKSVEKPAQSITISITRDTTVIGKENTKIMIPANSFVYEENGALVSGKVEIKLKEYYKISDMILANLSTSSGNEMLETGGMIYIEALSNGKKCKIANGKTVQIGFPNVKQNDKMQKFNGILQPENKSIDWILDKNAQLITDKNEVFLVTDEPAKFPGGDWALMEFISKNVIYPKAASEKEMQGKAVVQFLISETGDVISPEIVKSTGYKLLDDEALRVVKLFPKWTSAKQRGKSVKTAYTVPISFKLDGVNGKSTIEPFSNYRPYAHEINDSVINNTKESSTLSYLTFKSTNLGWINCDRFRNSKENIINYFVKEDYIENLNINIIFKNYHSILVGQHYNIGYQFKNVPINQAITIVSIKVENDQAYIAIKDTKIQKEGNTELEYKPVTAMYLKEIAERLNK